jgi:hypothetical protein
VAGGRKDDPNDDRQGFMLRLPKSLHAALRHLSIDRHVSLNALITEVLEAWWATQPECSKYLRAKKRSS